MEYMPVILVSVSMTVKTADRNTEMDIWVVDYWIGTVSSNRHTFVIWYDVLFCVTTKATVYNS
jgi:hypothetical protein